MEVVVIVLLLLAAAGGGALVFVMRQQAALRIGGAGVAGSIAGGRRGMDPFTVGEPWRRFVQDALRAQTRFDEVVQRTRPGPLRERLGEIGGRLNQGVDEVWATAQQGQSLKGARRRI